ncbi:hypothetical protein [Paraburkholderia sp. BL21I4N1]|nr:hypothetical protein [Paraburkholderia sp. BL21I4N1]PQV50662.1 hypothetical protein B0G83_10521 [Paraburkholderia sp. BL21I4N1]
MKDKQIRKPMPLWAIWLLSVLAVLAWSAINGEPQSSEPAAVRVLIRA